MSVFVLPTLRLGLPDTVSEGLKFTCTNGTAPIVTGKELRRIRTERLGLTQAGLGERIGVTPTSVARWEREERAIAEIVARFVTLLADVECKPAKRRRR